MTEKIKVTFEDIKTKEKVVWFVTEKDGYTILEPDSSSKIKNGGLAVRMSDMFLEKIKL